MVENYPIKTEDDFQKIEARAACAFDFLCRLPFGIMLQVMLRAIQTRSDALDLPLYDFAHRAARHADEVERCRRRGASEQVTFHQQVSEASQLVLDQAE